MVGIFNADSFDPVQLQKLSEILVKQENVRIRWKKSYKTEVQDPAQANRIVLEKNGQWFFRQKGKTGQIRLDYLEEPAKTELLKALAEHQMFTKPDWITSGFIFSIFFIIGLFTFGMEKIWFFLFLGILQFVVISRFGSRKKMSYIVYRISLWIGVVALCIPILIAIVYFVSTLVEMLLYTKKQFSSMYPMFNYETYFSGLLWIIPFLLVIGVLPIPIIKAYHQEYLCRKVKPFLIQ